MHSLSRLDAFVFTTASMAVCITALQLHGGSYAAAQSDLTRRIFFTHDSSQITLEGVRLVDLTYDQLTHDFPGRIIVITGHTDSTGPKGYNLLLSKRRAHSVADALVRRGIPKENIIVQWKGEVDMPFPTSDGVGLVLNRVVEISLRVNSS